MRTLMITGVCGVGKSTLTQEISKRLGLSWGDYADMMLEVMGETDKDRIQFLPWEERREIYDQVEGLIAQRFDGTNPDKRIHLLENHLSIIQDEKVVTFALGDYEKYNMTGLVVVEAKPEIIRTRRKEDDNRKRMEEEVALIRQQQETNLREAQIVSQRYDVPLIRLDNEQGRPPLDLFENWVRGEILREGARKSPEKL